MIRLKNEEEIQRIREASWILIETFEEILELAEPGITTKELDRTAHAHIVSRGGRPVFLGYMDYPASLCTSVNYEVIHGIPDSRKLKSGDILSLDCGVDLKGYISDAAVTLAISTVSPGAEKLMKVTEECLYLGIEQAICGNRIRHISQAIYNHAASHGYGVVHQFCGHGVGFDLHEEPQVPNYISSGPNPRLKKGMVLAIEPMINMGTGDITILDDEWTVETADRELSAHFEHTVVIHQDHTEILTSRDNYK